MRIDMLRAQVERLIAVADWLDRLHASLHATGHDSDGDWLFAQEAIAAALVDRYKTAHAETLKVFAEIGGDVSPRQAAKYAADYMLEVLTANDQRPLRVSANLAAAQQENERLTRELAGLREVEALLPKWQKRIMDLQFTADHRPFSPGYAEDQRVRSVTVRECRDELIAALASTPSTTQEPKP